MSQLLVDATAPNDGMSHARLLTFLSFLASRLAADDYAEAQSLLHAAISPVHAARRHEEARRSDAGDA